MIAAATVARKASVVAVKFGATVGVKVAVAVGVMVAVGASAVRVTANVA